MNLNRFKQLLESQMGDVKPLISEQDIIDGKYTKGYYKTLIDKGNDILTNKGYKEDPNYITNIKEGKLKDFVERQLEFQKNENGFVNPKIYVKGETVLISDGARVFFIVSPENASKMGLQVSYNTGIMPASDFGPYTVSDIESFL